MSPAARKRWTGFAPWIALLLTVSGLLITSATTWGRTCQRVEVLEVEQIEHKNLVHTQIEALDLRLRAVEQATEVIPSMAQDIRDIRNFLLEERQQ